MQTLFKILLVIHILGGFAGLILFWVPVFTRKGGVNHGRIGYYYVIAMWAVVSTAFFMSIINAINGRYLMAGFLGYLALITAQPLWLGMSVLKNKREPSPEFIRLQGVVGLLVGVLAMGLLYLGVQSISSPLGPVMVVFGVLGVIGLVDVGRNFGFLRQKERQANTWLNEHLTQFLTTGIAAHTAFLVFGASSYVSALISGPLAIIPWVSPTVIGFIGMYYARKKFVQGKSRRNLEQAV